MDNLPRIEGVAARVSQFVRGLPEGELFTTRDLLNCGKRGAVDQATRRMVNKHILQRVARGVFCRVGAAGDFSFSAWEVAKRKALAFGKDVATMCTLVPDSEGQMTASAKTNAALASGSTSKFEIVSGTVWLRTSASRKIRLGNANAGAVARAIWRSFPRPGRGKGKALSELLLSWLTPSETEELCALYRLLPAWLNDCLALTRLQRLKDPAA